MMYTCIGKLHTLYMCVYKMIVLYYIFMLFLKSVFRFDQLLLFAMCIVQLYIYTIYRYK